MPTPWNMATMHFAVVDLVASVGLWQRVAWGNVVWFYAPCSQIAMHTVFIAHLRQRPDVVAFHASTMAVYLLLFVAWHARRT